MNINEIAEEVASHQTKWVLTTGGEPLSQKNCLKLVERLNQNGKNISIETSGEISIEQYAGLAKIIMDVKTPSSEETATVCFDNFKYLLPTDEIKFVIQDEKDYEFAKNVCAIYALEERFTVLFSPVFDVLSLKQMSEWILRDKLNVRMQTQLHKYIWGKNVHGV